MKRKIKKIISLCTAGIMMMGYRGGVNAKADYEGEINLDNIVYVSLLGKKDAEGTLNDPFASIEDARDYLREKKRENGERGVIYLREGVYHIIDTVKLNEEDSYITLSSYGDERVEITGSTELKAENFKKLSQVDGEKYSSQSRLQSSVKDKVYVYDLGAEDIPVGKIYKNGFNWTKQPLAPELVTDGKIQILAQYPNDGSTLKNSNLGTGSKGDQPRNYFFDKTDNVKTYEEMLAMKGPVFTIKNLPDRAKTWAGAYDYDAAYSNVTGDMPEENPLNDNTINETDGWLGGHIGNDWSDDNVKMYSVKKDGDKYHIYCKYPSMYAVGSIKVTASNLLCELDCEEEYYIDRFNNNNVLYYYPKDGEIEGKTIKLTALDKPLLAMENTRGVEINGIIFTGTTNSGITTTDAESCTIANCELYNISMDAVRIGGNNGTITGDPMYQAVGGGHNNRVVNCEIHDMGHGGVYVSGGDCKSLERGDNIVENCEIYNFSRLATYTPGIYLEGVGHTARNNYLHDAPHMMLQIMGNDMLITHNKFKNAAYNSNDQAPIYIGRNWMWMGNEICYNYIDNVHWENSTNFNFGIYMDDNTAGTMIHNNIFNKVGGNAIYCNTGFLHYAVDNIIVDTTGPYCRFLTEGKHSWKRKIPNEKPLKYRFYDIMRTEEEAVASGDEDNEYTKGYWNTRENIDKYIEHYNEMYNSLPEFTKKSEYKFDLSEKFFPEDGDASAETWMNRNNVMTCADMTFVRNITVNSADFWNYGGFYNDDAKAVTDPDTFDVKRHRASSTEALGLDMETGKISYDSTLAGDENYGREWIDKWNDTFSLKNTGKYEVPKKERLVKKIAEAEAMLDTYPYLEKLVLEGHGVSADIFASESEVKKAYTDLVNELGKYTPQYVLNIEKVTMIQGDEINLQVENLYEGDCVSWSSKDTDTVIVGDEGTVYAICEGDTIVTACVGDVELSCEIKVVIPEEYTKIEIDESKVTVSSTENSTNKAANAVDGKTNTRWSSKTSYPQWIEVDLGKNVGSAKMCVNLFYNTGAKDTDRAYQYVLYGKGENDDEYKVLCDESANTDKKSDLEFILNNVNVRYLKLEAVGCDRGQWSTFSIWDIAVYEKSNTATKIINLKVDDTAASCYVSCHDVIDCNVYFAFYNSMDELIDAKSKRVEMNYGECREFSVDAVKNAAYVTAYLLDGNLVPKAENRTVFNA